METCVHRKRHKRSTDDTEGGALICKVWHKQEAQLGCLFRIFALNVTAVSLLNEECMDGSLQEARTIVLVRVSH